MTTLKNQVLKISTSGSVDDGKSTLIGRILYETHALPDDKLEMIERRSKEVGSDYLDFSLATDGLVAEREQGITIDVAHIYFATKNRSYIIADTPGHVEYTRNMITGASTSQASIILIDARKGVIEQTKRHFFITNLMRMKEVVVAINKMDLVDYDQAVYEKCVEDFKHLIQAADFTDQKITFIALSALKGDNISKKSDKMPWYKGETILDYLENIAIEDVQETAQARYQVQTIIRPRTEAFRDYRGYAGKLKGGSLNVGDNVTIYPSGRTSSIKTIECYNQQYEMASKGSSMTLTLNDEVNVARGDVIAKSTEEPQATKQLKAKLCWMDSHDLTANSIFFLQHGVKKVKAKVKTINNKLDITDFKTIDASGKLKMNEIGEVEIQLATPLYVDTFIDNKENGTFILVDPKTNTTSGVGFVQ